ncbi:MAG: gliding motility-associated protein GldE [Flavobacteriales bacterium TMED288]|nr:hypothetical protein [Flavobacteriales bacterium]RPG53531.1 MAG: gliding motility-associated protein GldE [Flavobacteriales bacterium TMED288]
MIISIFTILVLIVFSALISGSEVAFFSLTIDNLKEIKKTYPSKFISIEKFLKRPKYLLATILVTNNFINVGIIIIATFISSRFFHNLEYEILNFIIQVVMITFLLLLFGEVLPKIYANNNSVKFALFMIKPLIILEKIFSPVNKILVKSTKIIESKNNNLQSELSFDDLSMALEITSKKNDNHEEKKIFKGIMKFGNTDVKQIMRSRIDVTSIEINETYFDVLKIIKKSGYSRIPVYIESLDKIKGILYIKDLLPFLEEKANFNWSKLIRKGFFVPENKKIDDLLKEFQEKKIHLAIVVDEYGGTSGIVTLEDIIEEIVGEISDEFDDDNLEYSKLDDFNYVFEGKTPLNDFYRILDINGEEFEKYKGESDSLAGFIIEITGEIAKKNEEFKFSNFKFKIENVNERRITRIKVTILNKNENK